MCHHPLASPFGDSPHFSLGVSFNTIQKSNNIQLGRIYDNFDAVLEKQPTQFIALFAQGQHMTSLTFSRQNDKKKPKGSLGRTELLQLLSERHFDTTFDRSTVRGFHHLHHTLHTQRDTRSNATYSFNYICHSSEQMFGWLEWGALNHCR